jgi:O-antigen/teichoic acid export membrane protein
MAADEKFTVSQLAERGTVRALARAASGSFALNIVNTVAAILTTVLLARVMDLVAFGVYSWVMATVTLLTVPAVLGVDRLLVRDIAVYIGRDAYGHVRGLLRRSGQLVLTTCLLIAAAAVLAVWLAGAATDPGTVLALAVGMLALPLLAFGRVAQSALIGIHQVVVAQLPDLLLRPVSLLVAAGAVFLVGMRLDAPQAVALYTASTAVSLVYASILLHRHMRTVLRPARPAYETRRWLGAAFALVLLSGGLLVNSQIGVVLLGLLDGPESAGLYAVAQRGALLVAFPLMALGAALAPTAARLWAANEVGQLQRLVTLGARAVLVASVPIALVFVVAGEGILGLVFGASFVVAGSALAVLSLGQLVNAATGSVATLLVMTGNTWRASLGIVAGMVLNLVLAILLIPAYHTVGAAVAAAASLVIANLIHVVMARRTLGIDPTAMGRAPRSSMIARPRP